MDLPGVEPALRDGNPNTRPGTRRTASPMSSAASRPQAPAVAHARCPQPPFRPMIGIDPLRCRRTRPRREPRTAAPAPPAATLKLRFADNGA